MKKAPVPYLLIRNKAPFRIYHAARLPDPHYPLSEEVMRSMDDRNRRLLKERCFDTNFIVSAGAGAGKTSTVVSRIINLFRLSGKEPDPSGIVAITFTKKAATELKERMIGELSKAVKDETDPAARERLLVLRRRLPEMQISTIHSFCRRLLEAYPIESGVGFAPAWQSEDAPFDGPAAFFDAAWKHGELKYCKAYDIKRADAENLFNTLLGQPSVEPQYRDPEDSKSKRIMENTLSYARELLNNLNRLPFSSLYDYRIRGALLKRENASEEELIRFTLYFGSTAEKSKRWYGTSQTKDAKSPIKNLSGWFDFFPEEWKNCIEDSIASGNNATEAAKKQNLKGEPKEKLRREAIINSFHAYPPPLHAVVNTLEYLSDIGELDRLQEAVNSLNPVLHGRIMRELIALRDRYEEFRRQRHIVSFEDMLQLTVQLVRGYPAVREGLHRKYRLFFVDEYQDTDPLQTELIFSITAEEYDPDWRKCRPAPGSLFVVGDPKQSIYRFRNADIRLWDMAGEVLCKQGGRMIRLYMNYRSTSEICAAVTEAFDKDKPLAMTHSETQARYTPMVSFHGSVPSPAVYAYLRKTEGKKADAERYSPADIAERIREMTENDGRKYGDFLLLSYHKLKSSAYMEALRKRGIPTEFSGELPVTGWSSALRLKRRLRAAGDPLNESLSLAVLQAEYHITPAEWFLFTEEVKKKDRAAGKTVFNHLPVRSLARRTEELRAYFGGDGRYASVLAGLESLDRDRKDMESLSPRSFLNRQLYRPGLLPGGSDTEKTRNEYAVLLYIMAQIRNADPKSFSETASLFARRTEGTIESMPTVRAGQDAVRVMNLHKCKGLESPIVFLLPSEVHSKSPTSHIERTETGNGIEAKGWFTAGSFEPDGWDDLQQKEKDCLDAEKLRLKYVAMTRAAEEVHVFRREYGKAKKKENSVWDSLTQTTEVELTGTLEDPASAAPPAPEAVPAAEGFNVSEAVGRSGFSRLSRCIPSDLEKEDSIVPEDEADTDVSGAEETGLYEGQKQQPSGSLWGTLIHRTMELALQGGELTETGLDRYTARAARELYETEHPERERFLLQLPGGLTGPEAIRDYLAEKAREVLRFVRDEESDFRRLTDGGECLTEMPFTIRADEKDATFRQTVSELTGKTTEQIELNGIIDLTVRTADGKWIIIDYKTDRVAKGENAAGFEARLKKVHAAQLRLYKAVFEHITGESVSGLYICSVAAKGRLIAL